MTRLTAQGCAARQAALLDEAQADLLLISNPRHILYLSGLLISPLTLGGWGPAFLLLQDDGETELLVHDFLAPAAQAAHADRVTVYNWYDSANAPGVNLWRSALDALNNRLAQRAPSRLGVELGSAPAGISAPESFDITDTLHHMRRRKRADELALMRHAVRAVEAGHRAARQIIAPGVGELEVYTAVNEAIVSQAGAPIVPLGDFVSGERAFDVGGPPTERVLQAGDLMILDLFPVIHGYRADFTTTVAVDNILTPQQETLQTALHDAIRAGEALLRPGARAADIYDAVYRALDDHDLGQHFPHHAGHGLGLGHPEAPYFVPHSHETLLPGDVVTLEPGAYGADFGARIEHNYLITDEGYQRLTKHQTKFT
ncbi:MAG TPA: Xaa-Pro peptidase family protein [Candidatus Sulfomarinibacteraceae bacterium]|nr:Xaa-Pro peptidase family protein [Candidatus Sulfomarinibacteraceae bacterium]